MTAFGNYGRTAHSGFAASEAGENVVDCAGMPLTAARRQNAALPPVGTGAYTLADVSWGMA